MFVNTCQINSEHLFKTYKEWIKYNRDYVSLSQLYYDNLHMATCFDFQYVIFRPFELIACDQ
jgi:hypothetical protein